MTDWLPDAARYAEQWIDLQVRHAEMPGCGIAIASKGDVVAERAFGVADAASGTPLTPQHRFRVASHSKTFTAVGVMLLHEAGRLHLDDPVATHVAGLDPAVGATTVSQLLSHGAGLIRNGTDGGYWQDRTPFLDEAALRAELARPPVLDANTRFKYSNIGYGLLGLLIEAVTGERYEAWITRAVVEAAGLADTTPDMPPPGLGDGPMATGYSGRLPLGRRVPVPGWNTTGALASATGFVSTAHDLACFFGSLDPAADASVLSPASRREMIRRQWRVPHSEVERHYGLGTMAGTLKGHDWFGHSGGFQGFISRTACVPEWRVAVSILTNAVDGLANQWVEGVLGIFHEFADRGAPSPEVAGWRGRWWSLWGAVDLVPMGDKVRVVMPSGLMPFAEASDIALAGSDMGRVVLANGYGSQGEEARLERAPDGTAKRLVIGGTELVPETVLQDELEARAASTTAKP